MLYNFAYALVRIVVGLFFRVQVEGEENLPDGACLVVSNHLSWTDTIFILYALPRTPRVNTMANRSTVFNSGWKRWLLPRLAVFPVSRQRGFLDEEAVQTVYGLLESGERVLIFPEGAYGKDGQLKPLKEGIGHFAINSGRPLLPIVLVGTGRLRPFSRVTVKIGRPFIPEAPRWWELKRRVGAVVATVGAVLAGLGQGQGERRRWRELFLRLPERRRRGAEPVSISSTALGTAGKGMGEVPRVVGGDARVEEPQAEP